MKMSKQFIIAILVAAAFTLISVAVFAADPVRVEPKQKSLEIQKTPEIQKAPGVPPVKGVPKFKCTYKPQVSGIPAGGPLGGTGEYSYGMRVTVENQGSTKFYSVYSNLGLKVNGVNKSHTCHIPPGLLNVSSLDPGQKATHYLDCGKESNVTSSEIISAQVYVQSNDGTKFNCSYDPSIPIVY